MKNGYVRVAAMSPEIKVADCIYNTNNIIQCMEEAYNDGVEVLVLPEMCITGYTCNDLFLQDTLLECALNSLLKLEEKTVSMQGMMVFAGLPFEYGGKLYNVAAAIYEGKILGMIPKKCIPNYGEFYERRQFAEGFDTPVIVEVRGNQIPFGAAILFRCLNESKLIIGCEICEDLWTPQPPSIRLATKGATLIVNLSASNETIGKDTYRRNLVNGQSARLVCGYVYASAGEGESTQDIVFGAHHLIAENGVLLREAKPFTTGKVAADLDVDKINSERRRMTTFCADTDLTGFQVVPFVMNQSEDLEVSSTDRMRLESMKRIDRFFDKAPFVPSDKTMREERCEAILSIQAMGLKKRLKHTGAKSAVVGISGGLDSTLALLVTIRAFDLLGLSHSGIHAVTMPCFGTTDRTYHNALQLISMLDCTLHEINIRESVTMHFEDIGHDINVHDITYENGQARERTQILMDIANETNGMVIGTGDMSELALGWATYNGDHMSMYGVNASVPKTLVRHLVQYFADYCGKEKLSAVLLDILDTPVSPELLPPDKNGDIQQKTENVVGPYELHDFFLYYILRFGIKPAKLYRIACTAFAGIYTDAVILQWLKTFYRRFFSQQFKRSCLPDGPKVGSVAVSPRGDLRMPSDASAAIWLKELEEM